MDKIADRPFIRLNFDKTGGFRTGPIRPDGIRNLIVIAHGWKNDQDFATQWYGKLLSNVRALPDGAALLDQGGYGVTGVYWPAFTFKNNLALLSAQDAGVAAAADAGDLDRDILADIAAETAEFLELEDRDGFVHMVRKAAGGGGAADDLVDFLRTETPAAEGDEEILFEQEGRDRPGHVLFDILKAPPVAGVVPGAGGAAAAAGTGEGGGGFLSGARAATAKILNQFTYFEMKKRAGIIGQSLAQALEQDGLRGIRLHLIGHSFGARLVTSTAAHLKTVRPASMTLLQAAYSHNGLGIGKGSVPVGAFRAVINDKRVTGPIAITHTHNDRAVGLAYVIASRASGVTASQIGGPNDSYGGMGANGAQLMRPGEVVTQTLIAEKTPVLTAGVVNNLQADAVISDHNDIDNPKAARVIRAAIG